MKEYTRSAAEQDSTSTSNAAEKTKASQEKASEEQELYNPSSPVASDEETGEVVAPLPPTLVSRNAASGKSLTSIQINLMVHQATKILGAAGQGPPAQPSSRPSSGAGVNQR